MSTTTPYIDVDGHILEPADLWLNYIEPKYRDRTLKIAEDEHGLEYLSVDGKPSWFAQGGTLGALGAIGQDVNPFLEPGKIKWEDALLPGGYDPHERVKVMDEEGIGKSMVYPSLGLVWEADCTDPALAAANCRAYNNWVFDFCKPYPDRLIPVTHIPTLDVEEGVKELRRTAKLGTKAGMISGASPGRRPLGGRYFDPLWKEAEGLGITMTLHPSSGPDHMPNYLYPNIEECTTWWIFVVSAEDVKLQFTTFFNEGTFDKFPGLKLVVLESGTGWLVPWIQRMDDKFEYNGFTTPMKKKPSEYFNANCWIAMDPDDENLHCNLRHLNPDRFVWAYDYPHSDSITEPRKKLDENLAPLAPETRQLIIGETAMRLYDL